MYIYSLVDSTFNECNMLNHLIKTDRIVHAHSEAFVACQTYYSVNKNKKFRSFKSKENIHKKEVGPYQGFGY